MTGATVIAAVLLVRFTIDFYIEMSWWLALPFSLLVAAALAVICLNLRAMMSGEASARLATLATVSTKLRAALLLTVPLAFLASTLDCSGLEPRGCTPFCSLIKLVWIPLIGVVCAVYVFKPQDWLLVLIGLQALVTLLPHCVCTNVGNGWWIARLGSSPMCYVWGFTVYVISATAIKSGRLPLLSLAVNAAIIGGALTFFISHHYFHFPW